MSRRLYLDTADLLLIADGRVEQTVVDELLLAMAASDTRLTLTREHIWDGLSRVDEPTKQRVVAAVEAFGPILMVMDGPEVVEPLSRDRTDIVVQVCTNFRELVFAPAAGPWLEKMNQVQERAYEGIVAAQTVRRAGGPEAQHESKDAQAFFLRSFVTLCAGWKGDDAEVIATYWENELGVTLRSDQRQRVIVKLRAVAALLRPLRDTIAREGIDPYEVLRMMGAVNDDDRSNPGRSLAMRVAGLKERDVMRRRSRSDMLDLGHISHFPYVDFATCDANSYPAVIANLARVGGPRRPEVFRVGNLPSVSDQLRRTAATDPTASANGDSPR
jgi:hypothetical protein